MRKLFCFLLLVFAFHSTNLHSQTVRDQVGNKLLQGDSTVQRLQRSRDSILAEEQKQADNMNRRTFLRMAKEQDERRKKQKTWAYIRIGIGILLVIVLILGWNRRGKKTATP